jgi:hypothetical protein
VFATGVAQAKIKPIPRPSKVAGGTAAASSGALVAPIRKPVLHARKPVVPARKSVRTVRKPHAPARTSTRSRLRPATVHRGRSRARVVARSRGGRQVPPAVSHGGRRHLPPPPVVPKPTPLGFVAIGEALPASDDWPAWVFSLLGVLAASELFLLVHLVRARPLAQA